MTESEKSIDKKINKKIISLRETTELTSLQETMKIVKKKIDKLDVSSNLKWIWK